MEQTEQQLLEQSSEEKQLTDLKNLGGGLEILVDLAEKGDIDPWDIDIIEVTDKYLKALNQSPRENLLNAGRAIFFASVLLRLKSDILLNISNETLLQSQQTEDFFPEDQLLEGDNEVRIDLSRLESFIVRSSLGKQQRKRKIILSDLITALQQAEEEEERRTIRRKLRQERLANVIAPIHTPDDILEIAQEEDVEEITEKIEAVIQEYLTDDKPITLSFLIEIINDKFKPFIALMFLAHSGKVVLVQNEFYGEIYVHKAGTVTEDIKQQEIENRRAIEELKQKARERRKRKKKQKEKEKRENEERVQQ